MVSKRIAIELKTKVEIINQFNSGAKQTDLAKKYAVDKSTISKILKDKESLLATFHNAKANSSAKKLRSGNFENLDAALITWFSYVRSKNVPINGPILAEKAFQLALELGIQNFSATSGYIERFKKRHSISFKTISGESAAVDSVAINQFKERIPTLLEGFSEDDIYNMDETGLFYRMLPNQTLEFKRKECRGGKHGKERITVVVCTNMSGNDKRKLLVIGKSAKPRALKNVLSLPVTYKSNSKSWMTSTIFQNWIVEFDTEMKRKSRKILLFVDNCPSHPHVANLSSITLVFLPPNCTSVIQPCDQGIIHSLKVNYRKRLIRHLINEIETTTLGNIKIDIKQAIYFIYGAWISVSKDCIRNCFTKSGFTKSYGSNLNIISDDEQDSFCVDLNLPDFNIDEYVSFDYLPVSFMPTDAEIVEEANIDLDNQSDSDEDLLVDIHIPAHHIIKQCVLLKHCILILTKKPGT